MTERLRPIMGLCNLPFGLYGGVMLATIPQLLAAQGVPQPDIASVTAIGLGPGFCYFLASPILDVRFSRRFYACVLGSRHGASAVRGADVDRESGAAGRAAVRRSIHGVAL